MRAIGVRETPNELTAPLRINSNAVIIIPGLCPRVNLFINPADADAY